MIHRQSEKQLPNCEILTEATGLIKTSFGQSKFRVMRKNQRLVVPTLNFLFLNSGACRLNKLPGDVLSGQMVLVLVLLQLFTPAGLLAQQFTSAKQAATYTNPVLPLDYSDPDVLRVGGDFYLTASSFNCVPGLPILHSRDLVNWELINHALKVQPPLDNFPRHRRGISGKRR